jgi:hypothetical protein
MSSSRRALLLDDQHAPVDSDVVKRLRQTLGRANPQIDGACLRAQTEVCDALGLTQIARTAVQLAHLLRIVRDQRDPSADPEAVGLAAQLDP